jgi:hypothetical protein
MYAAFTALVPKRGKAAARKKESRPPPGRAAHKFHVQRDLLDIGWATAARVSGRTSPVLKVLLEKALRGFLGQALKI